jgi:hypothetical protein
MDARMLGIMIPILALAIPVSAIVFGGHIKLKKLSVDEARARASSLGGTGEHELAQLRAEVDQMRGELSEVHERLDFTERLLAKQAERPGLGAGG